MSRRRVRKAAPPPTKPTPMPEKRLWIFRLAAAVVAPLFFLAALEVGLRLAGYGYPTSFFLEKKIQGKDSLIENEQFGWRFFGPDKARSPFPVILPKEKAPGTVRVFVFGESAAYGDPQPEYGLPRMLTALLSLRFPQTHFEVVNTGITGINSHVVLPIAEDCAAEQGDYWLVYMGNNEVVGPFGSGTVFGPKAPPRSLVRFSLAFKAARIGQLLDSLARRFQKRDVEDQVWGGMRMFLNNRVRQDDPRMEAVYRNFQANLDDIIDIGARHGAQVIVSTMARNVRDCAPFASDRSPKLSAADAARWNELYGRGTNAQNSGDFATAVECFKQAAAVDASDANVHFRWGQCALALKDQSEASRQFDLACDADELRFRSDTRINDIIRQAAESHRAEGVKFVDAQETLAADSPDHLVGDDFLYEHVHLNFSGNYRLARALAQQIAPTNSVWPSEADCVRRLAFTYYNRSEGEREILQRESDAPYTSQLNHAGEMAKLRQSYDALLPELQQPALMKEKEFCLECASTWPDDWLLWEDYGLLANKTADNPAALTAFEHVTKLLPQSHEAWKTYGVTLAQLNRMHEAMAAFHEALRLHPDDISTLDGMAQAEVAQGKTNEAMQVYQRILKVAPYFGPAHLGLGKILDVAGQHDAANAEFRQSMAARINTPDAFSGMGRFFFTKGDFATAATNFADQLRISPDDAEAQLNLGLCLTKLDRWPEAQQHYAESVRLNPNSATAHFCLGLADGHLGDDTKAMGEFDEAARLRPDLMEAHLNLGISLYKLRRWKEARDQLETTLKQSPGNKIALGYLGAIAKEEGNAPKL